MPDCQRKTSGNRCLWTRMALWNKRLLKVQIVKRLRAVLKSKIRSTRAITHLSTRPSPIFQKTFPITRAITQHRPLCLKIVITELVLRLATQHGPLCLKMVIPQHVLRMVIHSRFVIRLSAHSFTRLHPQNARRSCMVRFARCSTCHYVDATTVILDLLERLHLDNRQIRVMIIHLVNDTTWICNIGNQ